MNRFRSLPVVLELLDDGLRLYRRNLAGFTLVSTAVLVGLALLGMSFMAVVRAELGGGGWTAIAVFLLLMIGYPLTLYGFAALSRAAGAALDGQPVSLPSALRLSPARGCGMLVFNAFFAMFATIGAGIVSTVVACPLFYLPLLGIGLASSATSVSGAVGIILFAALGQAGTFWSIAVSGAWLASMVFSVQPFALEQQSWSAAVSRALDVLFARFGRTLLMFLGAGAIFGTLILSYFGSIVVLLSVLQSALNLDDLPPLVGDITVIVVLIASLVVLLPPLAIWMAMFFRHTARERDGSDMSERVAAWQALAAPPSRP